MKVLYDYQAFHQKFGGVPNIFVQLIKNLPQEVNYEIAITESDNVHLKESGLLNIPVMQDPPNRFIINKQFRGQYRLYNIYSRFFPSHTSYGRNRLMSISKLKEGYYDIFHPTYFDDYFLPYLNGRPFVLTIHDMIAEKFPDKTDKQNVWKRELVKKAAHVVAISETTKNDIMDILGVPSNKISVIYHAVPDVSENNESPMVNGKYILYVGNRVGYKNFIPMVKEMAPVLMNHQELILVCTGGAFSDNEVKLFNELGLSDRIKHIHPSDCELRNLYKNALCFVYPSLYEGFGIPILEAWNSDCPVLLNNKSCFPEIANDAAIYFNLDSEHSNLQTVMEDFLIMPSKEIDSLKKKQRERLSFYSWKKSAQQLYNVYQSVLS